MRVQIHFLLFNAHLCNIFILQFVCFSEHDRERLKQSFEQEKTTFVTKERELTRKLKENKVSADLMSLTGANNNSFGQALIYRLQLFLTSLLLSV